VFFPADSFTNSLSPRKIILNSHFVVTPPNECDVVVNDVNILLLVAGRHPRQRPPERFGSDRPGAARRAPFHGGPARLRPPAPPPDERRRSEHVRRDNLQGRVHPRARLLTPRRHRSSLIYSPSSSRWSLKIPWTVVFYHC
jgi:hypothetical protein